MTQLLTYVEIDVDSCSLTYSVAPCQATLTGSPPTGTRKCFNTKATCQDTANFTNVPITLRFAISADYLPPDIECIPNIVSVDFNPATLSLGTNLGQRATIKVIFRDHPHSDTQMGIDKYLTDRNYDPFTQGTYWGKFRARNPFIKGRPFRLIQGTTDQDIGDMETHHFVMESFDGPLPNGQFTITAQDILKLADGDRAQAPFLNTGSLSAPINNVAVTATLAPVGVGNSEYAASGLLNIGGKEIVSFTRVNDVLTITRAQLNTVAVAHDSAERVQQIIRYVGQTPADIIYDLLTTYASVDPDFIVLTDWQDEVTNFINRLYTGTIPDPTSVNQLVSEIVEQAGLVVYWDDITQMIRLQVLRAVIPAGSYDQTNIIEGSLSVKEQPTKRVSQAWTYYALIDPLKRLDVLENFQASFQTIDATTEENYGSASIKKILSRWIPSGGLTTVQVLNDLIISQYKDPPRQFQFDLMRYAGQVPVLGGGYYLSAWPFQDDTGAADQLKIQITRIRPDADRYSVEAEEMLFTPIVGQSPDTPHLIIFDANTFDVNLRTIHDALYPAAVSGTVVRAIVQAGVIVGATSTANRAFDIGSWPAGVLITVQVEGRIEGKGGDGGGGNAGFAPHAGGDGGTALYSRYAAHLEYTDGQIWSGGGGGGGGATSLIAQTIVPGGGGGGGGGSNPGAGGPAGGAAASDGSPGTTEAGGAFGSSAAHPFSVGGAGGNPGFAGSNGFNGNNNANFGVGGAAGTAIDGISFFTLDGAAGDRRGAQIN